MALEDLCAHVLVDFEQIAALAVLQHGLVHVDDGGVAAHGGAGLHGFGVGLRGFLSGFQYQWVEQGEVCVLRVENLLGHVVAVIAEIAGKHCRQMQTQALSGIIMVNARAQFARQALQVLQIRSVGRFEQ